MDVNLRLLLILFVILYPSLVFLLRTVIVWKKIGSLPITYGKTNSKHDRLGRIFKILVCMSLASAIIYLESMGTYQKLLPITSLEIVTLRVIGIFFAYTSMIWTIISQAQMGSSWRIGIDEKNKTRLVVGGVFKLSRNPIYLGVIITLFSLFLVLPNLVNLVILLATITTISMQVKLEEEYLKKIYGEEYLSYIERTPRWL
ncbi:MAG: hypothetical protein A3C03_00865 [Candidatus Colwellbacteria bacterium RIFCSPHIGHO2_02_FULL_45_17]|uniref:Isoprenylcysteine carboxyl methyltransferase n=2 Tax=Parcubacteria group TaxID=1794811 RepID=A0A0H4TP08_9BACT|nr:hypothetical protein [uncultured Parcubacteria bacterium Rifle_16ft_4_minimus_37647]OGY57603.1 MAG: hypothetical protein A3C03_00865 [Candidatus Colwellbacteria bacterium RIFCSPHIGHO2_02_FULL_45_17]OGY62751.1 MAG: hypothetical protein A3G58_02380 [Candidatus Colwellbacteria bacterium RIFCSPLOWO2_12_FULL_46_17]